MVGCNNPKVRPDTAHIELMKKLLKNDIIVIVSGCSAQAAAKAGLMNLEAAEYCGEGLKRVCKLVGIPPILHMGSCVDISRMMILASDLAKDWGINISQIPLCGCAPEWMSEKAVSIGNYVVATGIETYLGVDRTPRARARSPRSSRVPKAAARSGSRRTSSSKRTSKSWATA